MNYILAIALFLILGFSYLESNGVIISPNFIITAVFFISSIVVAINTTYWEYTISYKTALIIISAVLCFQFGQLIGTRITKVSKVSFSGSINAFESSSVPVLSNRYILFTTIIGLVTNALYFFQQYRNALLFTSVTNLISIVTATRFNHGDEIERAGYITFLLIIFKALTYVSVYLMLYAKIVYKKKVFIIKLIPIVLMYLFVSALSTNRSDLIIFASSILYAVGYVHYKRENWIRRINKKMIKVFFIIFICLLIAFRLFGYLTGKSTWSSVYDNISIYIGSSIICLDRYVTGESGIIELYKPNLIKGVFNFLEYLGIDITRNNYNVPFQYWNNGSSNVYSSLFPYLVLFKVFGLLVFELFFGFIYGYIWKKIQSGKHELLAMCYGGFFYYLTMFAIAERMISQFITLTALVEILVMVICWYYLLRHKKW